jgi:hypothetical protein
VGVIGKLILSPHLEITFTTSVAYGRRLGAKIFG